MHEAQPKALAELEIDLLVDAVGRAYDLDVRRLPRPIVEATVASLVRRSGARTVAALIERVLHEPAFARDAVDALCACDARLFGDRAFYAAFQESILPWLRTYPYNSIWIAECGAGGDVYSVAILLHEAGLLERTCIHATDRDRLLLAHARQGIIPAALQREAEDAYRAAGGRATLAQYFDVRCDDMAVFAPRLLHNVVWSHYDLQAGQTFNEFNLIVCRGTLTEWPESAQRAAIRLLNESLSVSGLLVLDAGTQLLRGSRCYKRWRADVDIHQRTC